MAINLQDVSHCRRALGWRWEPDSRCATVQGQGYGATSCFLRSGDLDPRFPPSDPGVRPISIFLKSGPPSSLPQALKTVHFSLRCSGPLPLRLLAPPLRQGSSDLWPLFSPGIWPGPISGGWFCPFSHDPFWSLARPHLFQYPGPALPTFDIWPRPSHLFFSHLAPPSHSHLTPPIPFSHHPPTLPQSSGWAHALLVICFQSLFPVIWLAFWSAGETLQGLVEPLPGPALDGATEDCGRV